MNSKLNAAYTKQEVKEELFQMFFQQMRQCWWFSITLFQRYGDLCGNEVTCIVIWVLSGEYSPEGINTTFIALIP
jgi:hypothetical protein